MARLSAARTTVRGGFPTVLLIAGVAAVALVPSDRAATARPPAPLPPELRIVPTDAALFAHADAAKLWGGPVGKSLRAADPQTFADLTAKTKALFGVTPDSLKSATVFWPRLKGPQDILGFGVVLVFNSPFEPNKLKAGFDQLLPKGTKHTVHAASDRIAVCLFGGLDEAYARPRPAGKAGPLTPAIREAATGKHLLVAASALDSLPDEIRGDDVPREIRPFQSLLRAESITGIVDLDKNLSVEIRVKAATPPRAAEAEKALGLLVELMKGGLAMVEQEIGRGGGANDPATKNLLAILKPLQAGLKGAKFATEGEVARASATIPADLPFAAAFLDAKKKVQEAAARAQSQNNLKQIALAFHNYHDTYGAMPPAAVCDKTGKPMLSWRVLILPYVEQGPLYKEFKLDEPWDSEHNKKLLGKMPKTYAVPVPTGAKPNETHYRVFVGNGAAFDYLKGPKLPQDFPDGTSNTILVVTAKDAVPWTKPDELAFDPDKDMKPLLGFFPGPVCPVACADGSVRALSKGISRKTLSNAINRNDGQPIGDDF